MHTTQDPPIQDADARGAGVRLDRLLAALRLLAGRRGASSITWWGQGFRYRLTVERGAPVPYAADHDPDVDGGPFIARLVHAALLRHPGDDEGVAEV